VFAGCLTEAGETDLKKTGSNRLHPISMDVSKPESVRRALEIVKTLLPAGKGWDFTIIRYRVPVKVVQEKTR